MTGQDLIKNPRPTVDSIFPKRFVRGVDLDGRAVKVTIKETRQAEMYDSVKEFKTVVKWVVYFEGAQKGMVLTARRAELIAEIAGSRTLADWPGTELVIYPKTVNKGARRQVELHVRRPANGGGSAAPEFLDEPPLEPEDLE